MHRILVAIGRMPLTTSLKLVRGTFWGILLGTPGRLLLVGKGVAISHPNKIRLGKGVRLEDYCEVQGYSSRGITMGDNVSIGKYTMIRPSGYYSGEPGEGMVIGNNSSIGPFGFVGCSGWIEIGNDVMFGPRCSLFGENHAFNETDSPIKSQGIIREPIVVEDDCWIASGVTILAGVRIGQGSIVAAGSVVTKSIPPFSVVAGVPARVIRSRVPETRD